MASDWTTTLLKGENSQTSTAVLCALCIVTGTVVLAGTSKWWRGGSRGKAGGGGKRKGLAQSRGIRVVRVKDGFNAAAGSSSSNDGWGLTSSFLGGGRSKESATKWEQSKQKGEMGYYFAHHTSMKELAPEDYRMNGPRLLNKSSVPAANQEGNSSCMTPATAVSPPPALRRRAQMISSYSWEDYGEEVRLTFRQSGWEWGKVDEEEIGVEWGPRRFRLSIDSREYGLHTIDLPRLSGEISDVKVLKLRSKLVAALVKGGRGSYRKAPWTELQCKPAPPSPK